MECSKVELRSQFLSVDELRDSFDLLSLKSICLQFSIQVHATISSFTIEDTSFLIFLHILGCTETYEDFFMGSVHVKDVALAHILVYENKSATGRHLCVEAISHYGDFAAKVAELLPEYNVPR